VKLQNRYLFLTTIIVLVLCIAVYILFFSIITPDYLKLEHEKNLVSATQLKENIAGEINDFDKIINDWSVWDDLYLYASHNNSAFETDYLVYSQLNLIDTDFIMIFDNSGELIYSTRIDYGDASLGEIDSDIKDTIVSLYRSTCRNTSGTFASGNASFYIVCKPIVMGTTTELQPAGTIIGARVLSQRRVNDLSLTMNTTVQIQPYDASALIGLPSISDNTYVREGPTSSRLYVVMNDLLNKPIFVVTLDLHRDISLQGKKTLRLSLVSLLIIFVTLTTIILVLGNKIFKITKVQIEALQDSAKIILEGDLTRKFPIVSNDEIGDLAAALEKMRLKLLEDREKQSQLERIKTDFLSVTSHELRTPITPMTGQIEMMLGEFFGKLTVEQKNSLDMVQRNLSLLDHLIGDILDISKLESGNLKFIMQTNNLNQTIAHSIETMHLTADHKNIIINYHEEPIPEFVFDKDRIMQVMINLMSNAIKFTDTNGQISIDVLNQGTEALVRVHDTGIGISQEDIKRLFQPFAQVDSSRSRNYEGSGLGLAICKGIISNHGGDIWIESVPGRGSTFMFRLPYTPPKNTGPIELFGINKTDTPTERGGQHDEGYVTIAGAEENLIREDLLTTKDKIQPSAPLNT
jgi:signal transduction histidine kinase